MFFFFFQAEDGIRDSSVTGVQTCALPIYPRHRNDLQKLADVKYAGRKAIICLVGENVRETPGIAGQVFSSVSDVNVRMISQGASEINISFVVDEDDVPRAVQKLHQKFFAEVDPAIFE